MDLLVCVGAISYDDGVTNDDLWLSLGREMRRRRLEAGYSSTIALAIAIDAQNLQKTFDRIERGEPGQVRSLSRYCEALGTTLAEALRAILPAEGLSGRARQVAEAYDRQQTAQPLIDLALGLPAQVLERAQEQGARGGGRKASGDGSRTSVRTTRTRR